MPNVEVPCGWPNGDVEAEFCTPKAEGLPKAEPPPAPNADPSPGPVPVNAGVLLGASVPTLCLLAASNAPLMSLRALENICSAFARAFCSYRSFLPNDQGFAWPNAQVITHIFVGISITHGSDCFQMELFGRFIKWW